MTAQPDAKFQTAIQYTNAAAQKAVVPVAAGRVAGEVSRATATRIFAASPAQTLVGTLAASSAEGPAAIVAVPAGIVGEMAGQGLAQAAGGGETAQQVTGKVGGLGASTGAGAGVGAFIAGPPGAAAGAAVGAIGYTAGQAVGAAMWAGRGALGSVVVLNSGSSDLWVGSYNERNATQLRAYERLTLSPNTYGEIQAHKGGLTFHQTCSKFYLHLHYEGKYVTHEYGEEVMPGLGYEWTGSQFVRCEKYDEDLDKKEQEMVK